MSANNGRLGISGRLVLSSGCALSGNSGSVTLGSVATAGRGGGLVVSIGVGTSGLGALLATAAGEHCRYRSLAGLVSGEGTASSSGRLSMRSSNTGMVYSSCLTFSSGTAAGGQAVTWALAPDRR